MTSIFQSDNHLLMLAQKGRLLPSILTALMTVPAMLVLTIVSQILMRVIWRSLIGEGPLADSIAEFLGFSSIFAGLWALLHFWKEAPFWSLGFENVHVLRHILSGIVIAGGMMSATLGLVVMHGATFSAGQLQTRGIAALGIGALTLLATTVQSSAEEALFRGWLLPVVAVRCGTLPAVIASSLVFALAHATNSPPVLGYVNLALFGTMASLLALAGGTLWSACAWHAFWNWMEGGLLGFSVDRTSRSGLIASVHPAGPDYLTGGAFGPEGGIAATVILLAGIAIVAAQSIRKCN